MFTRINVCIVLLMAMLVAPVRAQESNAAQQTAHSIFGTWVQPVFKVGSVLKGLGLLQPGDLIMYLDDRQINSDEKFQRLSGKFGLQRKNPQSGQIEFLQLDTNARGVRVDMAFLVDAIVADSPADRMGIKIGDVISRVDGVILHSLADYVARAKASSHVELGHFDDMTNQIRVKVPKQP